MTDTNPTPQASSPATSHPTQRLTARALHLLVSRHITRFALHQRVDDQSVEHGRVIGTENEMSVCSKIFSAHNPNPADLDVNPDHGQVLGENLQRTKAPRHKPALDAKVCVFAETALQTSQKICRKQLTVGEQFLHGLLHRPGRALECKTGSTARMVWKTTLRASNRLAA